MTTPAQPKVSQGTPAAAAPASSKASAPTQTIGRSNYQPIILMEYVGCLVLTAATPIATKKSATGLSPYAGADMVKLASITVLYFILAAISVGGRGPGRMAAWFGGLILIVDGMLEANNIAKVFGLFTGGLASAATAGTGSAPAGSTTGPGLETPGLVQNVSNAALGGVFSEGNSAPQQVAARQGGGSIATPNF